MKWNCQWEGCLLFCLLFCRNFFLSIWDILPCFHLKRRPGMKRDMYSYAEYRVTIQIPAQFLLWYLYFSFDELSFSPFRFLLKSCLTLCYHRLKIRQKRLEDETALFMLPSNPFLEFGHRLNLCCLSWDAFCHNWIQQNHLSSFSDNIAKVLIYLASC